MFRRTRRPLRRCAVRLHRAIEELEVRRLFAVPIVVNTTLDETTPADGLTSLREAITMATRNPARVGRVPSRLRGLATGERADLIRFKVGEDGRIRVIETWMSGRQVFSA